MSDNLISRQAAIDIDGLDEQIRCEMCRNTLDYWRARNAGEYLKRST